MASLNQPQPPRPTSSTHPSFTIIQAPSRPPALRSPTVFLAGSIDHDQAPDWRSRISEALSHLPVTILNPLRRDWDSSWVQDISCDKFREQIEWELDHLEKADVIAIYFGPESLAPISLMELGLHVRSKKVVVACPEGYWKRGNVQIVCGRWGVELVASFEDLVDAVKERVGEIMGGGRERAEV